MRYIKHIIVILFVSLPLFVGCYTAKQIIYVTPEEMAMSAMYEGTWQYQDGNELFVVSLWKDDEGVFRGYYKKVEYNNGTIGATILNSRKVYDDGFVFPPTISGDLNIESGISGLLHDNTIENNPEDFKDGILRMRINSDTSCSSCPVTAVWKIEEESGMRVDFIPGFSVPTDVILTKVSNEIDLD